MGINIQQMLYMFDLFIFFFFSKLHVIKKKINTVDK